jgi:hypothetical protein
VALEDLAPGGRHQAEIHLFRDSADVYRTLEYCNCGLKNVVHKSRTGFGRGIGKSEWELLGLLGMDDAVLSFTQHQVNWPQTAIFRG